jgi:hypothetical protein
MVHLSPHGRWLAKRKSRDETSAAVKIGNLKMRIEQYGETA